MEPGKTSQVKEMLWLLCQQKTVILVPYIVLNIYGHLDIVPHFMTVVSTSQGQSRVVIVREDFVDELRLKGSF